MLFCRLLHTDSGGMLVNCTDNIFEVLNNEHLRFKLIHNRCFLLFSRLDWLLASTDKSRLTPNKQLLGTSVFGQMIFVNIRASGRRLYLWQNLTDMTCIQNTQAACTSSTTTYIEHFTAFSAVHQNFGETSCNSARLSRYRRFESGLCEEYPGCLSCVEHFSSSGH